MYEDMIGDKDLILLLGKLAYKRSLSILRNTHDAEDASQETMLALWLRSRRRDAEPILCCERWVSGVAANKARAILRRALNEIPFAEVTCQETYYDPIRVVLNIADGLDHKTRPVWILRFLQGATIRRISLLLHVSEGTVKRRLGSATQYAQLHISEMIEEN